MSAIQKLLPVGLAALLLAAYQQEAAFPVQPDIVETSTLQSITQPMNWSLRRNRDRDTQRDPEPNRSTGKAGSAQSAAPARGTVGAITPDRRASVVEKQAVNSDVVGWLTVPGTDIDDVVLQNPANESNSYYLNKDLYGRPDRNGTYCTDVRTTFGSGQRSELTRNTTVYGHSWTDDPNGQLFAQLKKYRDPAFAREHPYLFFSTQSETMAWEVFAVYDTHVALPYINPTLSGGRFFDMLDLAEGASLYNYPSSVSPQDKVLTLSTCVYSVDGHSSLSYPNSYRFVIMARLVDPGEAARSKALFTTNDTPLSPDEIYHKVQNGAIPGYRWS